MKKNIVFIFLTVSLILNILLIQQKKNLIKINEKQNVELIQAYPKIYDILNSITQETFIEKINNAETFNVYIGRPTCIDCTDFEPQLIELIEKSNKSQDLLYFNVASINNDPSSWKHFKERFNINSTPTFIQYINGEQKEKVEWSIEKGIDYLDVKKWINNL